MAELVFPSSDTSAAQDNNDLMRIFMETLKKDPTADFIALIPEPYCRKHQKLQLAMLQSDAARWNQKTMNSLQSELDDDPEMDLLSSFPSDYRRRKGFLNHSSTNATVAESENVEVHIFREKLDVAKKATVVYPLSQDVERILTKYAKTNDPVESPGQSLCQSLKRMLLESPIVWEVHFRGLVVMCNENIVAKVITGNSDYTEYTAMQFLSEHAPDIPALRPLGLVNLSPFRVIFMSCIPSMTLTEAWPTLSNEQKLSVKYQLDRVLCKLRAIKRDEGQNLGGAKGEGVKHDKVDIHPYKKAISKNADFEDFRFSVPHHGSTTYVKFLRSFLMDSTQGSVFTHGDFRPDNIMVELDQDNDCIVKGVIDWEDAGFYPDYHESLQMTRTLSAINEDDWYLYLPPCVAPTRFPMLAG